MNWPQYTYIALNILGLMATTYRAAGKVDGAAAAGQVFGYVVAVAIVNFLLYQGGFYSQGN